MKKARQILFRMMVFCILVLFMVTGEEREAYAAENTEEWTYTVSDNEVTLQRYKGKSETVIVPSVLEGKTVTDLGDFFINVDFVKEVTISANIKIISSSAFCAASRLEKIEVDTANNTFCSQDGIVYSKDKTEIKVCPSGYTLESFVIPDGVERIGDRAFSQCNNLKAIVLSDSVTTIDSYAFLNAQSIEEIILGNGLKSIGGQAFQGCIGLKSLHIPAEVDYINRSNSIISGCKNFTGFTVDRSNCNYMAEDGVLFNKKQTELLYYPQGKTTESYEVPKSVEKISEMADNPYLISLTLNSGIKEISSRTFWNDVSLKYVTISDTVEVIQEGAFIGCTSLEEITLPEKVRVIGGKSFYGCSSLQKITILNRDCYFYPFNTTIPNDTLICGYSDSTAYKYALNFGKLFFNLDTMETSRFILDNDKMLSMLPTSEVSFGEQACSNITYVMADGRFGGYQMKVIHEADTSCEEYIALKNFTDSLVQDCTTDYEKVKTISKWVTGNMTYQWGMLSGNTISSVYAIFEELQGNCMCYTQLTNYMLFLVGIPTVDIVSYGHEWGAAFVDGKWINVDSTHGLVGMNASYQIQTISFSADRMSFIMNSGEGVYLAGIGYNDHDAKIVKEITIPSFVNGIYPTAFNNTPSDIIVHGKKGSYADTYVQQNFKHVTYDDGIFTAYNNVSGDMPTISPSAEPTVIPTTEPSETPTILPDLSVSAKPTVTPAAVSPNPTTESTITPSDKPTVEPIETKKPFPTDPTENNEYENLDETDVDKILPTPVATLEPSATPSPYTEPNTAKDNITNSIKKLTKGFEITDKKTKAVYKITGIGKSKTVEYVKSIKKNPASVTVPNLVKIKGNTYKVTSVGKSAFKNNKKVETVKIGKNIKKIGKQAFFGCTKLKDVTLGKNVTTIEANAFSKCSALTLITIPFNVKRIGEKAFYQCKNLRYIMIKTNKLTLDNVGKNAFGGGYGSPRVKTDKSVWKVYSKILTQRGLSGRGVFIVDPVKLVI